jgi:hypothetical protein
MNNNMNKSSIEDLYPGHSQEWYAQAEANLDAYLSIVLRVYQRISQNPEELVELRNDLKQAHQLHVKTKGLDNQDQ